MQFNLLDIAAVAYIVRSALRGMRRGLAQELPGALSGTIALVTGAGLLGWSERLASEASHLAGQVTGGVSFGGVLVGTFLLWRYAQRRIREWAEHKFSERGIRTTGGLVAGAYRSFMLAALVILFISVLPLGPLKKPFTTGSLLGRNLNHYLLPVYKSSHQKEPPPKPAK